VLAFVARPTRAERQESPVNDWQLLALPGRTVIGRKRPMTRHDARSSLVVGTGVDPVTFRFSGGRSAN
jgi:hypothetical protein